MGEYSAGITTKNKIIQSCKKLFYEYGIEDTTYKMICESAQINRGLLPYHFKSKDNIARHIYDEFLQDFENWVDETFSSINYVYRFATSNMMFYQFVYGNQHFLHFYRDLKVSPDLNAYSLDMQIRTIQKLSNSSSIEMSEQSLHTLACMYLGVERELINQSYLGFITENANQIAEKDILFVLSMLNFNTETIRQVIRTAKSLSTGYHVEMKADFKYNFFKAD